MMNVEFDVVLTQDETTQQWIATVPSLHSCHTFADTRAEALVRVQEAIRLCLEDSEPVPTEVARVRV